MNNTSQILSILKKNNIRHTSCRVSVLDIFIDHDYALTHPDIEKIIGEDHDRVTIYRTLSTFLEKGVVHKVLDDEGTPKYALCSTQCSAQSHSHEHVHFKCQSCGHTQCLDNVSIPVIDLPEGYQAVEANLLLQGLCPSCNT